MSGRHRLPPLRSLLNAVSVGALAPGVDRSGFPADTATSSRRLTAIYQGSVLALALLAAGEARALIIEFDYRYDTRGFFTDQVNGTPRLERRAVLEQAASFYAGFSDQLSAIEPGTGSNWSVTFTHPSLQGPPVTVLNESIPANTLRVFVGGSSSAPGVLGFAGVGSALTATGPASFVDSVLYRGQANAAGAVASDFGPWGGAIWFNANNDWYFGLDGPDLGNTLVPGRPDFVTTATHELAHILGYGEADSWFSQVEAGAFTGTQSVAAYGAAVPLDSLALHWANGIYRTVDGVSQETLMDPSTERGLRELPTDLDYAGLADIGWQVTPVPVPPSLWLAGTAISSVMFARRTRSRHDAQA